MSNTVADPGSCVSARGNSTPESTNIRHFGGGSCFAAASLAGDVLDCTSVVEGCCTQSKQSQNTMRCRACGIVSQVKRRTTADQ